VHTLGACNPIAVIHLSVLPDVPKETSLKMFTTSLFTLGKKGKARNNLNAYKEEKNNGFSS